MKFSRRQFHHHSLQFLSSLLFPSIISRLFSSQPSSGRVTGDSSLEPSEQLQDYAERLMGYLSTGPELLIPTYLGNPQRRYYGRGVPQGVNVLQKFPLGTGVTYVGKIRKVWSGAGWTGQPTIARDEGRIYLVIGSNDYHLRKIDFETNEEVWRYNFGDVIKGSSSLYIDPNAEPENQIVILQGSRTGRPKKGIAPSFRAISFRTGKEIWKLNIPKTASYSRDNDSTALPLENGQIFNAAENGIGYFLNRSIQATEMKLGFLQPEILGTVKLYTDADRKRQGGNLVSEASPSRLGDRLFLAAGSGHIYGIDLNQQKIIWDFYTGSDLDGSVVIGKSGKLFCAIEKQYIPGKGGIIKLNPEKSPVDSVEWFLPTGNTKVSSWRGVIVGSAAINDEYNPNGYPELFATNAIDGYLYIGSQMVTTGKKVKGPLLKRTYAPPKILVKKKLGASISTPIFTDGYKLVTVGYNGLYLFDLNWQTSTAEDTEAIPNSKGQYYKLEIDQVGRFNPGISFESTPVVWDGKIIICCRDGFLYTLGA
ncbi:MAG: hypothetical protein ACFBSC_11895 [Microcoleaceae cyanobacterium]